MWSNYNNEWFNRLQHKILDFKNIILMSVLGALLGGVVLLFWPKEFLTYATILPPRRDDGLSSLFGEGGAGAGAAGLAKLAGFMGGSRNDPLYQDVLKSYRLLVKVLDHSAGIPGSAEKIGDFIKREYHTKVKSDQIQKLNKMLTVDRDPVSGVTRLICKTKNPYASYSIIQNLIYEANVYYKDETLSAGRQQLMLMDQLIAGKKAEYIENKEKYELLWKFNKNAANSADAGVQLARLELQGKLEETRQILSRLELMKLHATTAERRENPELNVLDIPRFAEKGETPSLLGAILGGLLFGAMIGAYYQKKMV